jgi:hypothetical protein
MFRNNGFQQWFLSGNLPILAGKTRQTDIDGPKNSSSLTIDREVQQINMSSKPIHGTHNFSASLCVVLSCIRADLTSDCHLSTESYPTYQWIHNFRSNSELAVPWVRRLDAGLSPWRPGITLESVHVGSVVDKVALGQVPLWVSRVFLSISFHRGSSLSYISWGMNNMPVGSRNSETQSQPIDTNKNSCTDLRQAIRHNS